jgi:hypothetical protein
MAKAMGPVAADPHRAEDDLQPHELQRDVGHRGQQAREGHGGGHRARAEAPAHEVGRRDVAAPVRDDPQARHREEDQRVDDDRVGQREEALGADAEDQGRHRDEGVRGVEVAAEQEPGDHRAEAPAAEAPFVERAEVAAPPARGDEPEHGHQTEQQPEDDERDGVGVVLLHRLATHRAVDDPGQQRGHGDPRELVPVEERKAEELGAVSRVERGVQQTQEREGQQHVPPPRWAAPLLHAGCAYPPSVAAQTAGVGVPTPA